MVSRGFQLRGEGALADAAGHLERAYRCMPREHHDDPRWEVLVDYLDLVHKLREAPGQAKTWLCQARGLLRDYLESHPARAALLTDARQELDAIDKLLAPLGGDTLCDAPAAPTTPPMEQAAPANPPAEPPPSAVPAQPLVKRSKPLGRPGPVDTPRTRPLWIAASVTGVATLASFSVLVAGLAMGQKADANAANATKTGDWQYIHDVLHPDGVRGNRMAYAGAIVGGVFLVTTVALLATGFHRRKVARRLAVATGMGLQIRF